MTSEEMWEKFLMIKEITDKLGLPIIDDEIVELCKKIHKENKIVVRQFYFQTYTYM